jgi:hypothetical protein
MRKIAIVLLVFLGACASANQQGQVWQDGGLGPLTDAAKMAEGKWLVSCVGALSGCTWRAAQICPSGFDAGNPSSSQSTSGAVGPYGGGFNTATTYTMQVSCKS